MEGLVVCTRRLFTLGYANAAGPLGLRSEKRNCSCQASQTIDYNLIKYYSWL